MLFALIAGQGHQHLGVKKLLHGTGASSRRSRGAEGDVQDGEVRLQLVMSFILFVAIMEIKYLNHPIVNQPPSRRSCIIVR